MFPIQACAADKRKNRPFRPDAGDATVVISGIAERGQLLTATFNNNDPEGPAIAGPTYQWQRSGVNIGGATSSTYTTVIADIGHAIKVIVTYTDYFGYAETIESNSTSPIQAVDTGNATATVTGTPNAGSTLTCTFNNNDPDGAAIAGPTYQWVKGGVDISGQTASTYLIQSGDAGASIKCRVGYTDGSGFVENVDSNSVTINVDDGDAGASLSGTAQQGQTLTCTFHDNDPDGPATGISYQWQRSGSNIGGATSSTYLVTGADVGSTLRCRVNYTDGQGFAESIFTVSSSVVSGVTTGQFAQFDSGSGTQTIPAYNTLRIERWGGGASGQSWKLNGASPNVNGGNAGGSTSANGVSAGGGQPAATGGVGPGAQTFTGGAGGSGTSTGGAGGNGSQNVAGGPYTSGAGGTSPAGGSGGAGVSDASTLTTTQVTGNNGNAPGGGGSGGSNLTSGTNGHGAGGGAGGYYFTDHVLNGAGHIAVGSGVSWSVGAGGTAVAATGSDTGCLGGDGAAGRVRFTVLS